VHETATGRGCELSCLTLLVATSSYPWGHPVLLVSKQASNQATKHNKQPLSHPQTPCPVAPSMHISVYTSKYLHTFTSRPLPACVLNNYCLWNWSATHPLVNSSSETDCQQLFRSSFTMFVANFAKNMLFPTGSASSTDGDENDSQIGNTSTVPAADAKNNGDGLVIPSQSQS
jgi:hypothetical protein